LALIGFDFGFATEMPFDDDVTMALLPIPDLVETGAAKFPPLAAAGVLASEIFISSSMNDANIKGFIV
jgi:hypothetical protein